MWYNDFMPGPSTHEPKREGGKTEYPKDEYEIIPPQAVAASSVVVKMWETLGKPQSPFSRSGKKLMEIMISVWRDTWPIDSEKWIAMRKNYQNAELDIKEQVHKKTGRSLASYPYPLYQMMKKVFPKFDPGERKNAIKFVKNWPMFRMANKV